MDEKVAVAPRSMKSPAWAGILSFFLPFGVGAFYNEQKNKALVHLMIAFGLIWALTHHGNGIVFGLAFGAFYFYQIIDNVQSAKAINAAIAAGQKPAEVVDTELPEVVASGSVFWGITLIVIGVILILANFEFIFTYRTLGHFWPVAVIIVGLKLVADAAAKSKKKE